MENNESPYGENLRNNINVFFIRQDYKPHRPVQVSRAVWLIENPSTMECSPGRECFPLKDGNV